MSYLTLNDAVFDLRKRGYRLNFYYYEDNIICFPLELVVPIDNVNIDEVHTIPVSDENEKKSVLYAISIKEGQHGILFDCSGEVNLQSTVDSEDNHHQENH
ncbi:hypothetical protein [Pedobacter cryophilus]|uniref:Uncharacterized protein n=1 Tax=Pedobacter cryophilus TaxID=2571271 RepID=A0A4U1BYI5_9SPHI|nr:hypothetical protein [Pedobacter cryophilus]TKB97639.1 hypothetical protein FA046_09725 [Pedobacter cryophilus]